METWSALKQSVQNEDFATIKHNLNEIVTRKDEITLTEAAPLDQLLVYQNIDILILATQSIAELAKVEPNRKCLTHETIVRGLIPLLQHSDANVRLQTCRALGNICFENDAARQLIGADGLTALIALIRRTLDVKAFDIKLIAIACGCLMNLIMNDEQLQKTAAALDGGRTTTDIIEMILKHNLIDFEANEDCTIHALFILNMVSVHMCDDWLPFTLCNLLVDVLRMSVNPEISTLCLEILRMQCENDGIKLSLAKKGACELVYELVEKHGKHVDDEESRAVLKTACDLIVLILTGDESMEYLYDNGNGTVYQQMVFWLNSEDVDLLSTGVLAIGNFARNDSHCIQMVENGLAKKLLGILKYYSIDGDTKVQHALLSTLRNLSIPAENKAKLLNENLVETLLAMLNIDQAPVEFKLLGTLRMVVDGQEKTALDLIERREFIEKLVYWCYNSEHLGVRGEAPRLLAWLIKNCHSPNAYHVVLAVPQSIKCLVEMMSSMHAVMQNEALLALNLLCASNQSSRELPTMLLDADIAKHFNFIIETFHEKIETATIENMLTLLELLLQHATVADAFRASDCAALLGKLAASNAAATQLAARIDKLIAMLTPRDAV